MVSKALPWRYLCIILVAVAFVTWMSMPTSPFRPWRDLLDQYVFLLMGKLWVQGCLPYVDYWELKGPIIFFINAVGYLLTDSRTGVYLIQCICMSATLCWMYRWYKNYIGGKAAFLGVVFSLACLFNIYGGNQVEEYVLPLLVLSYYYQYQWINRYTAAAPDVHRPVYAAFYGFVFAFCLLTRLTNALGFTGGVAMIAIMLMFNGQWKNLVTNILAFLGGFAVLFLPFAIYFYMKGALYEMWYGTLLFNLHYANSSSGWTSIIPHFRTYIDVYICMATGLSILLFNKQRRLVGIWMLCVSFFLWLWLGGSYGFGGYGIIGIPCSCIVFIEMYKLFKRRQSKPLRYIAYTLVAIYLVMIGTKDYTTAKVVFALSTEPGEEIIDVLMRKIPKEDYPFVNVYQTTPYCYLKYDIKPCYKYFDVLDFLWGMDEHLDNDMAAVFESCRAKWFIVNRDKISKMHIDPLLEEKYTLVTTYQDMYLYRRND